MAAADRGSCARMLMPVNPDDSIPSNGLTGNLIFNFWRYFDIFDMFVVYNFFVSCVVDVFF